MTANANTNRSDAKSAKLRSALRDNLKKRKGQVRKLGKGQNEEASFSVKLRSREIPTAPKSQQEE
jgi:hypothetical protein